MLQANSATTTYLLILSVLMTLTVLSEAGTADSVTEFLFWFALLVAFIPVTSYLYARFRTTEIVTYGQWRRRAGIVLFAVSTLLWSYSTFVFDVPLRLSGSTHPLALLTATLFFVGLADIGWTTGRLAESYAIQQTRVTER